MLFISFMIIIQKFYQQGNMTVIAILIYLSGVAFLGDFSLMTSIYTH